MKALVIIRTYELDDYISFLCYQSFLKALPKANYIFFAQEGEYKYIPKELILIRPYCCNFGGRSNVLACLEGLKLINTKGYDKIIFSDADIILHKNPLKEQFQFAGLKSHDNDWHYSGQMLLFTKKAFDYVVNYEGYNTLFDEFINHNRSISDDTIFSWVATNATKETFDFNNKGYWTHEKLHHLEP